MTDSSLDQCEKKMLLSSIFIYIRTQMKEYVSAPDNNYLTSTSTVVVVTTKNEKKKLKKK